MFGKASFNFSDKPRLRKLFKPKIFNKPSSVKCSRFLIISKHCLKSKKSECLAVTRGYLSKWSITTCNSLTDHTLKLAVFNLSLVIVPCRAA